MALLCMFVATQPGSPCPEKPGVVPRPQVAKRGHLQLPHRIPSLSRILYTSPIVETLEAHPALRTQKPPRPFTEHG